MELLDKPNKQIPYFCNQNIQNKMKHIFSILLLIVMLYSCKNNNSKSENSSKVVEESKDFNGLTQLKGQTFYAYHQKNPYDGESVSFLEDGRVRLGNSVCQVEMNSNINSDEITLKYNAMDCKFSFTDNNVKGDLVGNVLMKGQQIFLHIKSLKDNSSGIDNGYYELFHELKDEKEIERIISSNEKLINEIDKNQNSETNSNSNNSTKLFSDVQLTLTDASLKKAKLYLGEPDNYEFGFGHNSKGFAIYYNVVENNGETPKHLVLFLRQGYLWDDNCAIEEIYCLNDNEKACFGIHCLMVRDKIIYTNALNLIMNEGYKQL